MTEEREVLEKHRAVSSPGALPPGEDWSETALTDRVFWVARGYATIKIGEETVDVGVVDGDETLDDAVIVLRGQRFTWRGGGHIFYASANVEEVRRVLELNRRLQPKPPGGPPDDSPEPTRE